MKKLKGLIIGFFFLFSSMGAVRAQDPALGDWTGKLLTPTQELRIRFHIEQRGDGFGGTMDSPDQQRTGIPLDTVVRKGDSIRIPIEALSAKYKGVFVADDSLEGEWVQLGKAYPLNLGKDLELKAPARRQTPEAPFPYRVLDTAFLQRSDSIELAGTLTLPQGEGPFPGLVLVSGSGPQDRDETLARHKPFHIIADFLTREGYAVLRYDDRGVASSEGNFHSSTLKDFVEDAGSAYRFLKGYPKVDPERVGLLGHSEGGVVISRFAVSSGDPAFLIMMASPALRGDSTILTQNRAMLTEMGMKKEMVNAQGRLLDSLTTYIRNRRDTGYVNERLRIMIRREFKGIMDRSMQDRFLERYKRYSRSAWFRSFIREDPLRSYRKLNVPSLALFGENDLQVLPGPNRRRMKKAFQGDPRMEMKTIPGVNHLFQPDSSGLPTRYGKIETTLHPPVLKAIRGWLKKR